MATGDDTRWDRTWRERAGEVTPPAALIVEHAGVLPARGRALDVACGQGRHALWLAARGLTVTAVDVSPVAVAQVAERAAAAGLVIDAIVADLDTAPPPPGPWDVVLCFHFLCRSRWPWLAAALGPGGVLVLAQPTTTNLERHARPGARFLVEPGELPAWAAASGLEVVTAREGWTAADRHEAELVLRRA